MQATVQEAAALPFKEPLTRKKTWYCMCMSCSTDVTLPTKPMSISVLSVTIRARRLPSNSLSAVGRQPTCLGWKGEGREGGRGNKVLHLLRLHYLSGCSCLIHSTHPF